MPLVCILRPSPGVGVPPISSTFGIYLIVHLPL